MTRNTEKTLIVDLEALRKRQMALYATWYDEDTDARDYYADQQRDQPAWYEDDQDELHPNWIEP